MSPGGGLSRKRRVPTASARSRSDVIGTVETGEAARAGVAAVGGADRGRGTRGGLLARLEDRWSRDPAGPKAIVGSRGCRTSCCCCTPVRPSRGAVRRRLRRLGRRRARQGRGGRTRSRGLNRVGPLPRTPRRSRLGDARRGSRGFCGASADLGGYGKDRKRNRCRLQTKPARGRDSDRRCRRMQKHKRRISPKEQKGRQSSYVARVCENCKNRRR